jgi:Domain of unknown function (DUF1918)
MAGKPGNRIVVEAERVGQAERTGEILEVVESDVSVRYRVRWSDGRETLLTPSGGSVRIVPTEKPSGAATESGTEGAHARTQAGEASSSGAGKAKGNKGKAAKAQTKSSGKARKAQTKSSGKARKAQTKGSGKGEKGRAEKDKGAKKRTKGSEGKGDGRSRGGR